MPYFGWEAPGLFIYQSDTALMNMGSSNGFLGEVDFWRPAGEGDEGGGQGTVDGLAPGPGWARRGLCHGLFTQFYNLTNKC